MEKEQGEGKRREEGDKEGRRRSPSEEEKEGERGQVEDEGRWRRSGCGRGGV